MTCQNFCEYTCNIWYCIYYTENEKRRGGGKGNISQKKNIKTVNIIFLSNSRLFITFFSKAKYSKFTRGRS